MTGGNRGIGQAITAHLTGNGYDVAVIHKGAAVGVVDALELAYTDVCDPSHVEAALSTTADRYGSIGAVVNCAGVYESGSAIDTYYANFKRMLDVNVLGAFNVTKCALPFMRAAGRGRVVNIGSFAGATNPPGSIAYNVSKAALTALTKSTAKEEARHNITCNMVAPGCIDAGIFAAFNSEQKVRMLRRIPMHRTGEAAEVAALVGWLLDGRAGYITGQVIGVDGGLT